MALIPAATVPTAPTAKPVIPEVVCASPFSFSAVEGTGSVVSGVLSAVAERSLAIDAWSTVPAPGCAPEEDALACCCSLTCVAVDLPVPSVLI